MTDYLKQDSNYQVSEVKRIQEMFETGRLGRRQFLQGLIAAGLTATTAAAVITGSRDVQAETPKRGGLLRMAASQHGPDDTLDPLLWKESLGYTRGRVHYNSLVQLNEDFTVRPELATNWEVNSTATEFIFELKKDVTFHDGKSLIADDVVYSMSQHNGEDSVSIGKALVTMVREWKRVDKHTVKVTLDSPNADLPIILGTFNFKIVQENAYDDPNYFNKGIGTGPFALKEFKPGVIHKATRNENYWREGPWVDELHTFGIGDPVARVNALISEEVDMIARLDRKAIPQVEAADNAVVLSEVSNRFTELVLELHRAPGNNPDFVAAMKLLMPRKKMLRSILKGDGALGNDHPVGPTYSMNCEALPQRLQDLDKAKFHLKKSGIAEAVVDTSDAAVGGVDMCIFAQAEAKKIGLNLVVKRNPADGYWGAIFKKKPFYMSTWSPRPTGHIILSTMAQSEAPYNESGLKSARMDELLVASLAETDTAKRKEMFCEMETIFSTEAGNIIPWHQSIVDAISTKVKGMPTVAINSLAGGEFPEFVWLDS